MGGKNTTSTSQVSIPPQVLAQYQSVNAQADATAKTPFQTYSGVAAPVAAGYTAANSGTFVAPTNAEQGQGTSDINAATAPISGQDINKYLSPYLEDVLGSTEALQNQANQQAQAGQLGDAIRSGSFGGDRTGIAAANLQQQLNLANNSTIAGIANQGFQTAMGEANTEQAARLAGGEQEIGAGSVQQQTQQAENTAEYNQFLQQQSYPFQVDQFLANIAEGTGALSGSTTTTTQPGGFFSDRRLKRDIKKIGKTFDGQDVVSYKMGDDDRTRIGLIAQDVEKKHPHAVGLAGGFKVVDYGKATQKAANEGHFAGGGVVPFRRRRDAGGGLYSGGGLAGVLEAQRGMYAGLPGGGQRQIMAAGAGGGGHSLAVAQTPSARPQSGLDDVKDLASLAETGQKLYKDFSTPSASSTPSAGSAAVGSATPSFGGLDSMSDTPTDLPSSGLSGDMNMDDAGSGLLAKRGGRIHRDAGGAMPYDQGVGLNIPDNQEKVTPLPAAKTPDNTKSSGQQDIQDIATIAGIAAMFLKDGGVAKRAGYDGGGSIADDSDDPPASSDVAPAPAQAAAPAPSGGGLKGFWERNKGDILPILSGIGAMGSAKTVHPGVALAAGLQAAAEDYTPVQEGLAKAGLTQEQAKGVGLANTLAAAQNKVAIDALREAEAPPASTSAPTPAAVATPYGAGTGTNPNTGAAAPAATPLAGSGASPDSAPSAADTAQSVDQAYRQKYFVNPAYTPDEAAAMKRAQLSKYQPLVDQATFTHNNRIAQATAANQNAAQQEYYENWAQANDQSLPIEQRQAAAVRGNAIFQWTGGKYQDVSGSIRDNLRGLPPIGDAVQTLTPVQATSAGLTARGQDLSALGVLIDQNGVPWRFDKASNTMVRADGGNRPAGGAPPATAPPGAAPPSTGAATPNSTVSAPAASGSGATTGPVLPGFDISKLPRITQPSGFATKTSQTVPEKTQEYKAAKLADLPSEIDQAARNSATYAQLQSRLAKANPLAYGPSSSTFKALTSLKAYLGGLPPDGLVNQAEVDKYLSQMGVMGAKQLMGEGQQLRQQEMLMLMARANPNIDQPLQVIRNLAAFGQANNDYDLRAANTTLAALNSGADPYATDAAVSNQRPGYVKQRIPQVTAVRTGKSKGRTVVQYADGHMAYVD